MALELSNGLAFKKNDAVEIVCVENTISGTVVNAGEGYLSPYEDMYYLMSAPHKGIEDLLSEENEIKSSHVLVRIKSVAVPFSSLPSQVALRLSKSKHQPVPMNALAVIAGKPGAKEYLVFLEVAGKKDK
jgi:hypothetical protein